MKLSELLNIEFPHLEEMMSTDKVEKQKRDAFNKAMLDAMHRLVLSKDKKNSIGSYAFDISRSFGGSPKEIEKMYRDKYMTEDEARPTVITQTMLDTLERHLDKMFSSVGIDVEFTRHFLDLWETIKTSSLNKVKDFKGKIIGCDRSFESFRKAEANIKDAMLEDI